MSRKLSNKSVGDIVYARPFEIKKDLAGIITYIHPKKFFVTVTFEYFSESFRLDEVFTLEELLAQKQNNHSE